MTKDQARIARRLRKMGRRDVGAMTEERIRFFPCLVLPSLVLGSSEHRELSDWTYNHVVRWLSAGSEK